MLTWIEKNEDKSTKKNAPVLSALSAVLSGFEASLEGSLEGRV